MKHQSSKGEFAVDRCDPITIGIATLALAGGSAVSSYISQKKDAKRVQAENKQAYEANKAAAIDSAILNEHELSLRQSEEILSSAAQVGDMEREVQANQSTAVVSAAEAGVSGNSLDAVLADIKAKESRNKVRTGQNTTMRLNQIQRDKEAVLVEANNNINTIRQTNVRQPSILTPILQVGGAALQTVDLYRQRQANSKLGGSNGG
jgi:hypothetical protein